jgi:hypothetical protein
MCHATGASFEFWLERLVRMNRTSCIMLKVMVKPKLNPYLFPRSLRQNGDSVFCHV